MGDIKQLIKGAKLPERSVMICLDQGLVADIEELERKLEGLDSRVDTSSLAGSPRVELERQIEALREQMPDHSAEFRFRALSRNAYTALVKQHPPRDGEEFDARNGYNLDTFFEALVRACVVAPELDADDWASLLGDGTDDKPGVLSVAQFDVMANAAFGVNRRDVDVPFLPAVSHRPGISAAGLRPPKG